MLSYSEVVDILEVEFGVGNAILLLFVAWYLVTYNILFKSSASVEEGFNQIDLQLQRRNDLIPKLVNTVKGYASKERETLEEVIKARLHLISLPKDATPEQVNKVSNHLTGTLTRLLAVSGAYPELKANTDFLQLKEELTSTENNISAAMSYYNKLVESYNNKVKRYPSNIVANTEKHTVKALLETPA